MPMKPSTWRMVDDESIQPLVRMVNRIHITEEARHIGFARAERAHQRLLLSRTAYVVSRALISPQVYRSVGLDPREAHRTALANPAHRETIRFGGEKIVAFLADNGLIGAPAMYWWRKSYLLP